MARVEPLGVDVAVEEGRSLMEAAQRHGLSWPTVCGGKAKCGVCFVRIVDGGEGVMPPADAERDALRQFRGVDVAVQPHVRLACQLSLKGDVVVRKLGVRHARGDTRRPSEPDNIAPGL